MIVNTKAKTKVIVKKTNKMNKIKQNFSCLLDLTVWNSYNPTRLFAQLFSLFYILSNQV